MISAASKTAPASAQAPESRRPNAMRILAVVDGTAQTNRIVDYLVSLAGYGLPVDVVVLNVQTRRQDHRLRGYQTFKQHEIDDRLINDVGMPIVANVGRYLEKAGLRADIRVDIGEPVETILRRAAQDQCDSIVIGKPAPGTVRRWLAAILGIAFGPAASLGELSDRPVIVVK